MKMRETAVAHTTGQPNMVTTTPTLTPFVVTATPLPADVFVAATLVNQATVNATTTGTITPTPKNMLLATKTPTPMVVTSTPTAQNEATQVFMQLRATAIAVTTGIPRIVTATPLPTITATQSLTGNQRLDDDKGIDWYDNDHAMIC